MSDTPQTVTPPGSSQSLGERLLNARLARGMELSDVAEITHVRREYLRALEEGRYADLPEDVYTRNFLRLYAQTVGLDSDQVLDAYQHERREALGVSVQEQRLEAERRNVQRAEPGRGFERSGPRVTVSAWLPTLLLVAVVVLLALWGFNSLFFNAGRSGRTPALTTAPTDQGATSDATGPGAGDPGSTDNAGSSLAAPLDPVTPAAGAGVTSDAPPGLNLPGAGQPSEVFITVETQPAGAEVAIDGFPMPGVTPIRNIPVTPRESRVVRVELEGYSVYEAPFDMSFDRNLSIALTPAGQALAPVPGAAAGAAAETSGEAPVATAADQITLTVTDTTWLEVFQSTARNQGERLVYTTAQPGAQYSFTLPVYLHVGNAGGVRIAVGGQEQGVLGSPGAVVSRAITP